VAENDIFLEATKFVDTAQCGSFGQDARSILEGGYRDEGVCFERGLGDTKERGLTFCRALAFFGPSYYFLKFSRQD
jgi:hypothetical protein